MIPDFAALIDRAAEEKMRGRLDIREKALQFALHGAIGSYTEVKDIVATAKEIEAYLRGDAP